MERLNPLQQDTYETATFCHICNKSLSGDQKVRDHCHLTGQYRGPAHSECNLKYKVPQFIPIYFHNLSGYDTHLFFRELGVDKHNISVIAKNKENYISFTKTLELDETFHNKSATLRFVDSFKFMASSLDSLAQGLKPDDFQEIQKNFSDYQLLLQKGIYPYEYIDSFEKFSETSLPSKSAFFNKLTNTNISDEQYEHAHKIWGKYGIQNLGQYSDLYLKTDVLLLADIFENFRKECLQTYTLDPAHYFTAPGLSWDAMLKYTQIELDLLTDIEMVHFLRKGIRGGITQCTEKISDANNKYMKNYDSNAETKFNIYLDANNLYGHAMSDYLPYGGFRWLENPLSFDVASISDSSDLGYILEVDIQYPRELHDLHNDLPFCAENICPPGSKTPKLVPNLNNKHNYIIDFRNLKQCLSHGLQISKIHRVLEFQQKPWLKPYIELNNNLRTSADTEFKKNFYKYMNNSVFGKTMENVEKRVDVKIATRWDRMGKSLGARDLIAKPNFNSINVLSEEMAVIQMNKLRIYYNKPIYVGFVVLELSKKHMYHFHYEHMLKHFDRSDLKLCYGDTDSFIYQTRTDIYEHIRKNPMWFDTSNYDLNNPFSIKPQNKKKLGYFKDENGGAIMTKFVGLRAKMYAYEVEDANPVKKAKGIKKSALQQLNVEAYVDAVVNKTEHYSTMHVFRSKLHRIHTEAIIKKSLCSNDDKRFLMDDGRSTLAWGHYKIADIEMERLETEVFDHFFP
jgi:hypothetical protein